MKRTMTTAELLAYVGRVGSVELHGMQIAVRVLDSKVAYGGLRLLIEPADERSRGQTWIEERKVRLQ